MICPDCGVSDYLIVDGKEMTEEKLLHLTQAPKKIERRMSHFIWCPSEDNRMKMAQETRKGV